MAKKPRKEYETATVPISAMIDIVFLLIIFFVVTAAIDKEAELEGIDLCKAPHGKPLAKKDPRSVTVNVKKTGETFVGFEKVNPAKLSTMLRVAADKWGNDIPIIVRGDARVQHEYIRRVCQGVTDTGLYKVRFMAVKEDEKPLPGGE